MSYEQTAPPRVALHGAGRFYRRHEALAPLTLDLLAGQTLGLLGPNGAGKSTLMSIMACVLPPSQGQVRIDGLVVDTQESAREARKGIGFLQQKPSWVPAFTAIETVEYAAWLKAVPKRARADRAMWALDQVGLAGDASKRMKELSGGMVQRACLAAELVGRPRVLVLDEPTVGLDPAQRLDFRALISRLSDVTVVLSTHLVEDIAIVAERLIVLDHGRMVFDGRPADLEAVGPPDGPGDTPMERGYMSILNQDRSRGDG